MPKAIYAGRVKAGPRRFVRSAYYQPIVSVEALKNAQKALEKLSEGLDIAFPPLDEGVVLTLAG